MKVGVLGKISKVKSEERILQLIAFLQSLGYETKRYTSPNEIDGVDVVIVLGGDGAILHAAVMASQKGIKIIGINYGNLGFLTEYEKTEWEQIKDLLKCLEQGSCRILHRSILQVEIQNKVYYALNEIAVQRDYALKTTQNTQILRLNVETKEGKDTIAGDGLLICTPTGSTAYSLSAGGAIITPEVPVFMMTPICAFSMRRRPIVFADTEEFKLKVSRGSGLLLVDGSMIATLPENTEIIIKKAPFTADFPQRENNDFFDKVRSKLNE